LKKFSGGAKSGEDRSDFLTLDKTFSFLYIRKGYVLNRDM